MRAPAPASLLVALLLLPSALGAIAAQPARLLPQEGPDVPTLAAPLAELTPFANDRWQCAGGVRSALVTIPSGWDRATITLATDGGTDAYDRLFGVSVNGVEVLHGTTPRASMTLTRDITAYAAAMPPGATVPVGLFFGTYTGYQDLTVKLDFYADPATAPLVEGGHAATIPVFTFRDITVPRLPTGSTSAVNVTFPSAAPRAATVEFFTSGHGQQGEFFYLTAPHTPPTFHVLVDGAEIGNLTALPYVYALAGFGSIDCAAGTNSALEHQVMWWTAQRALDVAGVHTGVGEIPPYRASVPDAFLPLLSGNRTVLVTYSGAEGGDANWWSSLTFHLDR